LAAAGSAAAFPVANSRVVDDRVERPEAVHLVGDVAGFPNAGQIADNCRLGAWYRREGLVRPLAAACVEDDPVPVGNQEPRGHLAQPVGGAGYENTCHCVTFLPPERLNCRQRSEIPAERLR